MCLGGVIREMNASLVGRTESAAESITVHGIRVRYGRGVTCKFVSEKIA